MKKKYLFLLLIPLLILSVTACNGITSSNKDGKTVTLEDSKYGKTVLTYDTKLNYKDFKQSTKGSSKLVSFKNDDLNIKVEMSYDKVKTAAYDENKKSKLSQTYYRDIVFGQYAGYFYSNDKNNGELDVALYADTKEDMVTVLVVKLNKVDNKQDTDMFSMLDTPDIFNLFNSMKFEKNSSK